ncbi:MAG: hypothetical protein K0S55_171 [Clostridia bacterium]|jgi:hypothetical protein|nr:hypothetical protein [Clostridia bacterium]
MTEYIIQTIIAFFAVIGICEILLQIKKLLIKSCVKAKNVVLLLSLENEDIEKTEWILRSTLQTLKDLCSEGKPEILILKDNLREENIKICEILKNENDEISIINKDGIKEELDKCFT